MTGLTVATAGCTGGDGGAAGGGAGPATTRGLRRRAARDSSGLLAHYDATAAAHPALDATLTPLRAVVAAHVTALGADDPAAGGVADGTPEVPADAAAALSALADAERALARSRTRALPDLPPDLARLLASLAASGTVQAHLLNEARV
ncbi:hypothetical protein [Streptomyces avicenniae]|uniref:hypothetical protein n=1 Tax=Streptomyces avicenniae TaxID=500153 RepID=UPI00069CA1D6|nr:hypothetical protein [Streptomyces avicenniae]